jgi:ComF family protein
VQILKSIIDWILPDKCMVCGRDTEIGSLFCSECFGSVVFVDFPYCKVCGKLLDTSYSNELTCKMCQNTERFFEAGRSLFLYNNSAKRIIMRIKKEADEHIARKCSQLLCNRYESFIERNDLIVPVPSHFFRILKRGFNPSTLIAKYIAKISEIPMDTKVMKRTKRTGYQKNKTLQERQENVKNAFIVCKDVQNKRILLVDDVMTTGSTLSECSRILQEHGAKSVRFITIGSTMG